MAEGANWNLVRPRTWPLWLAFGLLRVAVLLPYPALMRCGRLLGRLSLPIAKKRAAIARRNLGLCFPELDAGARENMLRAHFESLGIALLEFGLAWWGSDRKLQGLAEVEGLDHLEAAASAGKGVLLLSAHFTCLEMGGRLLAPHFRIVPMYRPSSDPLVRHLMDTARRRVCSEIIPRDAVKQLIRSLRAGNVVWYAPDQNTGRRKGVFVDFFKHKACTTPASARLSTISGAPVVPFMAVRKPDDSGYLLRLEPSLVDFPSGDLEADTQLTNDIIERWIRQYPEQYLWIHRRFRTRPNRSDPGIY